MSFGSPARELVLILSAAWLAACQTAAAQPALEQLEESLRQQLPAARQPQVGLPRSYLGVVADDRRDGGSGVIVLQVAPASPAAEAGLQPDDMILAIDGKQIDTMRDMATVVGPLGPGQQIEFEIDRNGETLAVTATLGRRPEPPRNEEPEATDEGMTDAPELLPAPVGRANPQLRPKLGVRTQAVLPETAERLGFRELGGAIVVARTVDSAAARAGIPLNAIISEVDGIAIRSPEHLAEVVATEGADGEMQVVYFHDGQTQEATVGFADAGPALARPALPPRPAGERLPPAAIAENDYEGLEARLRALEARVRKLEAALEATGQPLPE